MKQKPTKDQIMQVLYENRKAIFFLVFLILTVIFREIVNSTPEMR